MKIAYISTSTIPSREANSIHVMKMCYALSKSGHEVTLYAPDKQKERTPDHDEVCKSYGVSPSFSIQRLPWLSFTGRSYIYGLLAAWKASSSKPDKIISRNIIGAFFTALLRHRVIFESHAPAIQNGRVPEKLFVMLVQNKKLEKIVVITHSLADYYSQTYPFIRADIVVAPDAADRPAKSLSPIFLTKKTTGYNRLQVGYVGQLYSGKGLEIISKLAPLCPWADFHIVGGMEPDIAYWSKKTMGISNVLFHGHVHHRETSRYIKAFDVVLLPNQEKVRPHGEHHNDIGQWTSPLKLFEYMSAGKPIIASNLPVLKEILRHKENALLCEPHNIEQWNDALEAIRNHTQLRSQLGERAYFDFENNYTWLARVEKLDL